MMIGTEEYLSVIELARKMCVTSQTINQWVSKGKIPSIKQGRRRYFNVNIVNDWLLKKTEI